VLSDLNGNPKKAAATFLSRINPRWRLCRARHANVLELHRADLTRAVFSFAAKRMFSRDDFEQDNRGIVRLSGSVAREAAALALRAAPMTECVKTVKRFTAWF
jgi:hypothetical protein